MRKDFGGFGAPGGSGIGGGSGFDSQLLHVQDQKPSGTDGGTFTAGSPQTRVLNTVLTNEIAGASLSSNQITLPIGDYWIEIEAPAHRVIRHNIVWRNITAGTEEIKGQNAFTDTANNITTNANLRGRFTITVETIFEVTHDAETTIATFGFGVAVIRGIEHYSDVRIWKLGAGALAGDKIPKSIVDAKGDLIGATAADTPFRLAVGTDGQVLTADNAETIGLKWAPGGGGGAASAFKTPAKYATVAALPASTYDNGSSGVGATITGDAVGNLFVDNTLTVLNDRLLIKDQATKAHNGIYKVTIQGAGGAAFVLTRVVDNDTADEMDAAVVFVQLGDVNQNQGFVQNASGALIIGTSNIVWTQFTRPDDFTFGDVSTLDDAATVTPAITSNVNLFKLLTTQNFTLNTPTGVPVGKNYKSDLFITQDSGGSNVMTVGTGWLVDSGVDPILTTDANAVDWLVMTYDGTDWFLGLAMGDAS